MVSGILLLGGVLLALLAVLVARYGWPPRVRPLTDGGYVRDIGGARTKLPGLARWFTTVDHRDIGVLYIVLGVVAALWGATDAMMLRTELLVPETTVWNEQTYNALFTTHGLTMLFFFVTPVFYGVGNYFLPILIGADDMAFPRINAVAFWLVPPAFLLVRGGLITEVLGKAIALVGFTGVVESLVALEPIGTGWTLYTPLSLTGQTGVTNPQVDLVLLGLHLSGVATTMGGINFIATVFVERDLPWARLDIFSWTMLTTSAIVLFAFPLLGSALVMLLLDRNVGTTFFTVEGGGPILWQHLFWFFGHPEVYILVLPAFGLVSMILPKFSGRELFGFQFVVYSTLAIGVLSFGVWAHHMFSTGIDPRIRASFMAVSLAIAIPSAVKVFNWMTTMWNGRIRLTAPMLFCIAGVGLFVVGGVTGVFLASIPVDLLYHDTYYVVGHFHFIVMGVITFAGFAAGYYWYPLLTGRWYDERLAYAHWLLTTVGATVAFGSMLLIGILGLPRRYASYPAEFHTLQVAASVGAFVIALGTTLWVYNMVQSARVGRIVTSGDPWELKETDQFSREWAWFEARQEEQRRRIRGERANSQRDG